MVGRSRGSVLWWPAGWLVVNRLVGWLVRYDPYSCYHASSAVSDLCFVIGYDKLSVVGMLVTVQEDLGLSLASGLGACVVHRQLVVSVSVAVSVAVSAAVTVGWRRAELTFVQYK